MEVKRENVATLSNFEVLKLLQDIQSGKGQKKLSRSHTNFLATICYETVKYLETTACAKQTPEIIANFMKAVVAFKLTKAEKLQILNQRPTTAVEIQLIVEESEERLTEDQIYKLLDVIAEHLPADEEVAEEMTGVEHVEEEGQE